MKDPEFGGEVEPGWHSGLASTLVGGALMITAALGMIYNILVASIGRTIMDRSDARMHGVSTVILLPLVLWAGGTGLWLAFKARGSLAVAGRALTITAMFMWLLFAIGQLFVLTPRV